MNKIIFVLVFAALSFAVQGPAFAQTNPPPKKPQQQPQKPLKQQKPQKPLAEAFSKAIRAVVKIDVGNNARVGSGVLVGITKQRVGVILTAYHVVKSYKKASVSFYGVPETYTGLVLDQFIAPRVDLALIFVKNLNPDQQVITIGKNCGKIGYRVAAIGHPVEQAWKLDEGILNRKEEQFWFTNVPVRSGSSGGPLLNERGIMLGVIQERIIPTPEKDVAKVYRTELVIPTLEAWFEQIKPDKKSPEEEPRSFLQKVLTEWKYRLPAVAIIGVGSYIALSWSKAGEEPDLPAAPGFSKGN